MLHYNRCYCLFSYVTLKELWNSWRIWETRMKIPVGQLHGTNERLAGRFFGLYLLYDSVFL
jgi:hypothetical protein